MSRIVHASVLAAALACLWAGCGEEAPVSPAARTESVSAVAASPPVPDGRPAEVRVGTLNVRWFPDGDARGPGARTTDIETLAAAIADLHVQALALEELLLSDRGERALERLRARLSSLTGGRWEIVLDDCRRDEGRQHVGILYDAASVERLGVHRVDGLSGNDGDGCDGYMRPGLAVALRFRGGFDAWLVAVHLDSGTDDRAYERRGRAYQAFARLREELARELPEDDILVLGDLNTMGNDRGVSGLDEIGELERALDRAQFRRLWLEPGCTEISGGRASMLDHVIVSSATTELAPSARAAVGGPCARARCRVSRDDPWLAHVSDHCPVTITLDGADRD